MNKNIAIIGTGYVGLTTGLCLASLGHKVICVDKDEEKLSLLNNNEVPIYEPGLKKILLDCRDNIIFTNNLKEAVESSDVIFIAVGTPSNEGGAVDMSAFNNAVLEIAESINSYKVIINKSTVPVGTGDQVKEAIKQHYNGEFSIVSNPEFLREGSAVKDFLMPDRIILGIEDKKAEEIMKEIYSSFQAPIVVVSIKSAELIKYSANAFLATKISFINEISNVCERTGADVLEVAKGIGKDRRIGESFLKAGIGFGGSCFPKDIAGLRNISANKDYSFKLLEAVEKVNEDQQTFFVEKIKKVLKETGGRKVGIWGLAFKPNTDDIRKSPALNIIDKLRNEGYEIRTYDPVATENVKNNFLSNNITFCGNPIEAARGVDVLVLVTEWSQFASVDFDNLKEVMNGNYIIDGRNFYNSDFIHSKGFNYIGVGRPEIRKTILVTGSAGFIGFHTAKRLLEQGYNVIGFDNFNDYYDVSLKEFRNKILEGFKNFKLYRADLRSLEDIRRVFKENHIDKICHLAAQAGVRNSIKNPYDYIGSNIVGFTNLIEEAKKAGVKDFIYASSSSVFGNNKKIPFSVTDNVDYPISLYAATKKANELIAHSYHHLFGMHCTGLRFFTVYGPYGRPDMALFKFVDSIAKDRPIDVYNFGKMRRDFTYIDDIVDGVISAIENSLPYEIFNLGSNNPVELSKFISIIEKEMNKEAQKNMLPIQPGDVPSTFADISKSKKILGYNPSVKIEEGIKKFVDWYKEYYKVN